jgi:Tol biopolymer transport system component
VAARSHYVSSERLVVTRTRAVTSEAGLFLDPALSPDGKLVAYASGPASRMHLFVRALDGGRAIPLTDSMASRQRWPRWSPDGSRIAFMSVGLGIAVVPALGGPVRVVVPEERDRPVQSPTWSPDGKRIAYAAGSKIRARDLDTGRDTVIADLGGPGPGRFGMVFQLAWSPDGKWIAGATGNFRFAFGGADLGSVSPAGIVLASTTTGRVVRLSNDRIDTAMELSPVWTSDSRHLLFVSNREGGRDVYEMALSSSMEPVGTVSRLTTGLSAHTITLSRDDRTLVYATYQPVSNIWSVPIPAGEETMASAGREITHSTELIEEVSASADGSSLVYASNRGGSTDLFRIPSLGGSEIQLTSDSTNEFAPVWSPDGKEILFNSVRNGRFQIMIVPGDGGTAQPVTTGRPRGADWSADGTKIFYGGDPGRKEPIQVIARTNGAWGAPTSLEGTAGGWLPRASPDGKTIAFIASSNPWTLATVPAGGGTPHVLVRAGEPAGTPAPQQPMWSRDSRTIFFTTMDANGIGSIWSVPAEGGVARPRLRFTNPDLQMGSGNVRFGVDERDFYVRLIRHTGAIGTADLERR